MQHGPWGPNDSVDEQTASPWGSRSDGQHVAAAGEPLTTAGGPGAVWGPTPGPAAAPARATPCQLGWGGARGIAQLSVVNLVLKILTLGIYGFWGKTELRQRIWSAVRVDGEPLEYTGTGRELMTGFMIVFGVVIVPFIAVSLFSAFFASAAVQGAVQAASYAVFALLYGIGAHRAQRYRLARTRWRGIRMRQAGSSWYYGWTYLWTLALMPVTLGWIAPWRTTHLQRLLAKNMSFGTRRFRFTASSGPLYVRFAILWIGTAVIAVVALSVIGRQATAIAQAGHIRIPDDATKLTLGITVVVTLAVAYLCYGVVAAWYRARVINHFAAHTHFETARFEGSASAAGLIWLAVSNALIVLGTVGVLLPLAQARSTRYLVEHLAIVGDVDLASIRQPPDDAMTRGEGLAQAFDLDAF